MRALRILLVDDQKLFTASLRTVLEQRKDMVKQVLVANDGLQALKMIKTHKPDIVLLDVHMPGMNGLETLRNLFIDDFDTKVIMLSAFGYDDYIKEAMEIGASGYVLKDISPEDLIVVVRAAYAGEIVLPDILKVKMRRSGPRSTGNADKPPWFESLTIQERKILVLISKGYSNKEIAQRMFLGKQTVRNYISSIYSKIGVNNRFEAIRIAIESHIEAIITNQFLI